MIDALRLPTLLLLASSLVGCGSESRSGTTPSLVHVRVGGLTTDGRMLVQRDGHQDIARVNQELLELPGVHDVTSALHGSDLEWRIVVDARSRTVWTSIANLCDQVTERRPRIVRDRARRWTTTTHADVGFHIEPSPLVRTLVFEPTSTRDVSLADLATSLKEVPGVRFAHAYGSRFERTRVEADADRLATYGLTADDLDDPIRRALGMRLEPTDLEAFVVRTLEDQLIRIGDLCTTHQEFVDSAHPLAEGSVGVVQVVHSTDDAWDEVLQRAVELGTHERLLVHWLHPTDAERAQADALRIDSYGRTVWIDLGGADDLTLATTAQDIAAVIDAIPEVHVWRQSLPRIQPELELQLNENGRALGLTPRDLQWMLLPEDEAHRVPLDATLVRTSDGNAVPLSEVAGVLERTVVRPLMNVGPNPVVRMLVRLEGRHDRDDQVASIRAAVDAMEPRPPVRIAIRSLADLAF